MSAYTPGLTQNNVHEFAPLSFSQKRIWFLYQLKPNSSLYNVFETFHFTSRLNKQVFQKALQLIIARHEILRTNFIIQKDQPIQHIHDSLEYKLTEVDLANHPTPFEELKKIATEFSLRSFDLSSDQLLRTILVQLPNDQSSLLVCMHHIITDAWSIKIFSRELQYFYEEINNGRTPTPGSLPLQYRDYAAWQHDWLNSNEKQVQVEFWKKQLSNLPTLQLPVLKEKNIHQQYGDNLFRGQCKRFQIPSSIFKRLKKITQQEEQTLFITLLATFKVLLFRYCGQEEIVVGSPVSGRNMTIWENLIGFFVNTVVLRTTLQGNNSFLDVSRNVRKTTLEALENQDIPFEMVVETLHPSRDISTNPLFQVVFHLQSNIEKNTDQLSFNEEDQSMGTTTSKFDLTLSMTEFGNALIGHFEYNANLFSANQVDAMSRHFIQLLKSITELPLAPIATLQIMSPAEITEVQKTGRGAEIPIQEDLFVHQLISKKAVENPSNIAIISGQEQVSYGEMETMSNKLANFLVQQGIGPESIVVVIMHRSIRMVLTHLAILKAGGSFAPLDESYPRERIATMLKDIKPDYIICESQHVNRLTTTAGEFKLFIADTDWGALDEYPSTAPVVPLKPHNRAYMMFTSGSTGKPKGVELQHGGFINLVTWNIKSYGIRFSDHCLQVATPAYDAYIFELFPCLAAGATSILVDDITRTSASLLRQEIERNKVHITFLSTAIGQAVMDEPWPNNTSLRILAVGGEKLVRLPPGKPPFKYINFYGPTENSVMTTCMEVPMDSQEQHPPIGKPLDNVALYVLDPFYNPVPIGIPGELFLGGEGVGRGYFNRPSLTAEKFVPDPFHAEPGKRLYRTGDFVKFLPDGNLAFIGRVDHQVKLRGFRIELEEIAKILYDHPFVSEAVVITKDRGNNDQALVAYVGSGGRKKLTSFEIKNYLKDKLPGFMIPASIVILEELPKSINGKIDRKALPEPGFELYTDESSFFEAETEMEKTISSIWKQFLPVEKINIEANFFDMGGHSLIMAQVHHKLKESLQSDIQLITLFQFPTIRSLARFLEKLPAVKQAPKVEDRAYKQKQAFLQQKRNHKIV